MAEPSPHRKVSKSSYGSLGSYTTKTRFPQVIPGPAAEYKPSEYKNPAVVEFRKAYVGRQMYVSRQAILWHTEWQEKQGADFEKQQAAEGHASA